MEFELEIARNENLRKCFELKKLHLEKILSNKKTTLFSEMQSRSIIYNLYHLIRLIQLAKRSVTFFSIWLLDSLFPSTFFFRLSGALHSELCNQLCAIKTVVPLFSTRSRSFFFAWLRYANIFGFELVRFFFRLEQ